MLADWQTALALDPAFDYGGPHRMVAEVFIALPKYLGPKDLKQDLNKAIQHLEKAIEISDYPTNYLDLGEAWEKGENGVEARKALEQAKAALPKWKDDPYYNSWQETLSELDKKLAE